MCCWIPHTTHPPKQWPYLRGENCYNYHTNKSQNILFQRTTLESIDSYWLFEVRSEVRSFHTNKEPIHFVRFSLWTKIKWQLWKCFILQISAMTQSITEIGSKTGKINDIGSNIVYWFGCALMEILPLWPMMIDYLVLLHGTLLQPALLDHSDWLIGQHIQIGHEK